MEIKNDSCLTNEAVLIQSVICTKKVKLIAFAKTKIKKIHSRDIQFIPDLSSIQINTTLLRDLIVIQGFVKGSVIIDGRCVKKITLSFQEEVPCEGACPGDVLKHTNPILEGVLPPQVIPNDDCEGNSIIFKVIFSIQVTVIREKLGKISVTIIGDINENRCKQQAPPTAVIPCEMEKEVYDHQQHYHLHHYHHEDRNDNFPCTCDESTDGEDHSS
jgi:hypothetical protein